MQLRLFFTLLVLTCLEASAIADNYALLINGGGSPEEIRPSDQNDIENTFRTLTAKNGRWKKENLTVLQSNGNEAVSDTKDLPHQKTDFDGDGKSDVADVASKGTIKKYFDDLKTKVKDTDQLLLWVADHGGQEIQPKIESSIVLWGESISVSELKALIEDLKKTRPGLKLGLVFNQCFSGGFQKLADIPDTCVITAASENEPSWSEATTMPFNDYLLEEIQKNPAPSMTNIYQAASSRDWHVEWNDLSSMNMMRQMDPSQRSARAAATIPALSTGAGLKLSERIAQTACYPSDKFNSALNNLDALITTSEKKFPEFISEFFQSFDPAQFALKSASERVSFINSCRARWKELTDLGEDVSGHYWGLQETLDQSPDPVSEQTEAQLRKLWTQYLEGQMETRKVRGLCRQAQRTHENASYAADLASAKAKPAYNRIESRVKACDGFKF